MPLAVQCPSCGTKLRAPDHAAGKRVQCPCGVKLKVPKPADEQSDDPAVSLDQLADGESIAGAAPCPQCRSPLADGAVLCTACGFSLAAGMRLATDTGDAPRSQAYTPPRGLPARKSGRDPDAAPFNWKVLVLVVVLGAGAFAGYRWIQTLRNFDPKKHAQEKLASIKPGMSLAQVVTNMGEPQQVFRNGTEEGTDRGLGYGPLKAVWSADFLKTYKGRLSSGFVLVYRFSAGDGHLVSFDSSGIMTGVEEEPNLFKG